MKYFNELSDLENNVYKVEEFKNIFKLVMCGIENDVDLKVIKSVLSSLEQTIIDASDSLNESFNVVWNTIREDLKAEKANSFVTAGFQQSFQTMAPDQQIPTLTTTNFSALTTADISSIKSVNLYSNDSFLAGSTTSYAYDPQSIAQVMREWRTMDQS